MATGGLSLPPVASYQAGSDFDAWIRSVKVYLTALGITSEAQKTAVLLHLLGPELQSVYETLPAPAGVTGEFDACVARLQAHLTPERSVIADRLAFQRLRMGSEENFDQFLGRLRQAAARCRFEQLEASLRDQLIAGCSPRLQERLLTRAAEKELSLPDNQHRSHG